MTGLDPGDDVGDLRPGSRRGRRRRGRLADWTGLVWALVVGCSDWPPPLCEHPATSNDTCDQRGDPHPVRLAVGPRILALRAPYISSVGYRRVMHERTIRAHTTAGTVEGFTRDGVNRWRSVPYARPPVGPLRFRAPAAGPALVGCAALPRLRQLRAPAAPLHDARPIRFRRQVPADERGLPDPQRRHARSPRRPNRCRSWSSSTAADTSWAARQPRSTTAPRWPAAVACTCR